VLPSGSAVVNVDQITMVVKTDTGVTRILFSGDGFLDLPHDLREIRNALSGREPEDDGSRPGFAFA